MALKALLALVALAAVIIGLSLPTPAKDRPSMAAEFASVDAPPAEVVQP